MKKLFLLLGLCAFGTGIAFSGVKQYQPTYAEDEPQETEVVEEEQDDEELEPINVDEEVSKLSQTAKDVIEVIKTIASQPIVIGGVSTTLGALLIFVIGKVVGNAWAKRTSKEEQKIKELLEQIGVQSDFIDELKEEYEKLKAVLEEQIKNTKNIKVKEKLESMLNEHKELLVEETKEIQPVLEVPNETQQAIKDILNK